jgi:hypothetical protein
VGVDFFSGFLNKEKDKKSSSTSVFLSAININWAQVSLIIYWFLILNRSPKWGSV